MELTGARYPTIRHYSDELLDLIQDCLAFEQPIRPTFRRMLEIIYSQTGEGPLDGNITKGMRSGSAALATRTQEATYLYPDIYYLGLTRANLDAIPLV